jgi:hypothetical protein
MRVRLDSGLFDEGGDGALLAHRPRSLAGLGLDSAERPNSAPRDVS